MARKFNCIQCGVERNVGTSQCHNCGFKIPKSNASSGCLKPFLIVLAVIFGFAILSGVFSDSEPTATKTKKYFEKYDRTDIVILAQSQIKDLLKAPSTADFPTTNNAIVERKDSVTWFVSSYVDSQNGFGAMIRSMWSCNVNIYPSDKYSISNVEFN